VHSPAFVLRRCCVTNWRREKSKRANWSKDVPFFTLNSDVPNFGKYFLEIYHEVSSALRPRRQKEGAGGVRSALAPKKELLFCLAG